MQCYATHHKNRENTTENPACPHYVSLCSKSFSCLQDAPQLAVLFGGVALDAARPGSGSPGSAAGSQLPMTTPPLGPTSLAALGGASRDAKAKNIFQEVARTEEDDLVPRPPPPPSLPPLPHRSMQTHLPTPMLTRRLSVGCRH